MTFPAHGSTIRLRFNSAFEMLDMVQVVSDQLARLLAFEDDALVWMEVAVRESVINAIKHGNRHDLQKNVFVEFTTQPADAPDALSLENPRGDVEFRGVSFGYRPDVPVLHDVSFLAPPGSVTAIVGRTGAGKTTIVNLLSRFYDATEGSVLIDGVDVRRYRRESLRRAFGVVLQEGYLFSGTVRENILYGRPGATEAEMRRAASSAGADHAIERLSHGYDTVLSESGSNLSQGQRQLIAIARAVLASPSLLVLDEATSAVDARTELRIQSGMIGLMKGRTSFIIAHRLSTIRDADVVLVVDAGRIVERGSPEELVSRDGYYKRLYDTQLGGVET